MAICLLSHIPHTHCQWVGEAAILPPSELPTGNGPYLHFVVPRSLSGRGYVGLLSDRYVSDR